MIEMLLHRRLSLLRHLGQLALRLLANYLQSSKRVHVGA